MESKVLVQAEHLTKEFPTKDGMVQAVSDVSISIKKGETLALVGESGCGKSTLGRLILRLIEPSEGNIYFDGRNISHISKKELRMMRKRMQLVFQDPYSSLDPRMRVRDLIDEPLRAYKIPKEERKILVEEVIRKVGLRVEQLDCFPHEFSGGQRQRIGIARAIVLKPDFVVCDEPVSALDVSIQAQILNLLQELQMEEKLTYLFISHDLSVVHHISDRVCVMFLGQVCEIGDVDEIFCHSRHPYTKFLLKAAPVLNPRIAKNSAADVLPGEIPSPVNPPSGCRFHTRCPYSKPICEKEKPSLVEDNGHYCACHFHL